MIKREKLLQYLQKNPGWHTSQELAVEIGSSKRTIKNYISQLKSNNYSIKSSVRGYRFQNHNVPPLVKNKNNVPNTAAERINYIINFLVNDASTLNSYDLAENLFVSETTVLEDLKQIQRKVTAYGMSLKRDGDYWHLIGNEREKRSLLSSLIYEETTGTFMNQEIIQDNFPRIQVNLVRKAIVDACNKHNVYLNTFDLNNILLHFVIVISRLRQGHQLQQDDVKTISRKNLAIEIVDEIQAKLKLNFEEPDRRELALIVQASLPGKNNINKDVSLETQKLVTDLIDYVWKAYNINLDTNTFKERFFLHLNRLIERARAGKLEHNPIAGNIKISSPTIYECAVIIANRILQKAKIESDDSEIAYIALHIGNAIAEQMANQQKLSVIVLVADYYGSASRLSGKLQKRFSDSINIREEITDPAQISSINYPIDLIIVVNSNYIDPKISTVNISQFLLPDDLQKLNIAVTTKQHQVKKDRFQEKLLNFFDTHNFINSHQIKNMDQAFDLVTNHFKKEKVVNDDFEKRLYQREQMSSTAFGRVAIPHTLEMTANKSRGFIIINSHGIKWSSNNEVYLVIALAIDPNNKQLFRDVFDELSDIVTDVNNVTKLISCKTYSEFIIKLVDLL